jgi:hypothetical protein
MNDYLLFGMNQKLVLSIINQFSLLEVNTL